MINISSHEMFSEKVVFSHLENAASTVLNYAEQIEEVDLSIIIETDDTLHELNQQYRGIDAPTDVLSFSSDEIDPESGVHYIGDIIISYPRAEAQAQTGGHPLLNELTLLTVHGVLHLLGYDHEEPEDKLVMWKAQEEILKLLNCEIKNYPE